MAGMSSLDDSLHFVKMSSDARSPRRGSPDAAGLDLFAAEDAILSPGGRVCVKMDLQVAVPRGSYGRVAPRSGLAVNFGIDVGGGVIDADYRGNVAVILFNHGTEIFHVRKHDRIAQLILEKIYLVRSVEVPALGMTDRGDRGFGSTGSV